MVNVSDQKTPSQRAKPSAVVHLSAAERAQRGKVARAEVPRASHAGFEPSSTRPDPIGLLEEQAASRVAELVPIRYGRMLVSPFAFYRGAALIMASDLATTPRSGLMVQACGDAHMSNFGVFASAERNLVFDVNDFDETLPGPWEWDVKRLAGSLVVAGRDRGFSAKERTDAVLAAVEGYRNEMQTLAGMRDLEVWYRRIDADQVLKDLGAQATKTVTKRTGKLLAKAHTQDSMAAFNKLCQVVDGQPRIVSDPPLISRLQDLLGDEADQVFERIHQLVRIYRRSLQADRRHLLERFKVVDMARKVVGVGSVGTRAWILLMEGRDEADPLFLQAKEAQASVLERFVGKSSYTNQGERVVAGQHLMQASSDIFLGWERNDGIDGVRRDYYLRQLKDWKGSVDPDQMIPETTVAYAQVCGWTLARAHARSGDRIAIAAYLGNSPAFDRAIASFAESYAEQNQRDYQALQKAVADGRVTAQTGL
ncbi:MAG TPA: DUF2252 domain-containing protein [Acidimicrobiales bacterium]|nr:DUF2252 domain-containing protein [Acidimicrobiales bacterium]